MLCRYRMSDGVERGLGAIVEREMRFYMHI
jgi:hypothetical protein